MSTVATGARQTLSAGVPACILVALLAGLLCLGCEKQRDWTPGPEETSTRFLDREVAEALAALDEAQRKPTSDSAVAARSLVKVRAPLLRLRDYYLPMLEARASAYNALRWYHLGDSRRALDELQALESVLLGISDRQDPQLSREVEPSLEMVVAARAAVRAGRPEAGELIERLGSRTNLMLLKGDLVLHGSSLDER